MLSWFAQKQADFVVPRGGIGVLTRKLASILKIDQNVTVRYVTAPDTSGRHTVRYLTPGLEARSVTPDVVVVATEGKFVYPLVQGLTPQQDSFFRAIDFTKEAIVWYVLDPKAAPATRIGGAYIPSHPDRMKRRVTGWDVNPSMPDYHNRPPTARVALSRPETPRWQMSNEPMEKYCEPIIRHFWPEFDMRNVTDFVNYTCDDLIQLLKGGWNMMGGYRPEIIRGHMRPGMMFPGMMGGWGFSSYGWAGMDLYMADPPWFVSPGRARNYLVGESGDK